MSPKNIWFDYSFKAVFVGLENAQKFNPSKKEAKRASIRADIYSLGVAMCKILFGEVPFTSDYNVDKKIVEKFEDNELWNEFDGKAEELEKSRLKTLITYMLCCEQERISSSDLMVFKLASNLNMANNYEMMRLLLYSEC
eukprot:TRINITY_DN5137_c0_g1_i2.p1 TRINITY_DN5137_c0_g1~~TRINITY_DN5137_c0_g1_i2.p1  ORF type:complete len:140 (+),score=22.36 TRINITY_DN5137_c0_g1_i2:449-868(+)